MAPLPNHRRRSNRTSVAASGPAPGSGAVFLFGRRTIFENRLLTVLLLVCAVIAPSLRQPRKLWVLLRLHFASNE
jgi:hypothetical protein